MEMKKIISALAVGAVAAGIATADLSLKANFKLSSLMYRYNTGNLGGSGLKQKALFDLPGQAVNDNITMTAKGNVFTFETILVPYDDQYDEALLLKKMTVAANLGDFTFTTGWNKDGLKTYGPDAQLDQLDEGGTKASSYSLGSAFNSSPALYVNNQQAIGKDVTTYFVHGKYALGLGDLLTLNLAVSAMSPHGLTKSWDGSTAADNTLQAWGTGNRDNDGMAWGVFVNPVVGKIIGFDLFAKGWRDKDDEYNHLLGGYAQLLAVPIINTALLGGSVWLHDGDLEEWNVDMCLGFKFGDRVQLSFNNKFAYKDSDAKGNDTGGIDKSNKAKVAPGKGSQLSNEYILWDYLGVSFKLNDTLTLMASVGQQTALGDATGGEKGTSLFVYPHARIYASSAASVGLGAWVTLDKLGYKKDGVTGDAKKMAILVNVPVVVKIGL